MCHSLMWADNYLYVGGRKGRGAVEGEEVLRERKVQKNRGGGGGRCGILTCSNK